MSGGKRPALDALKAALLSAGFTVVESGSAEAAAALAPALIVLPCDPDGLEASRRLKATPSLQAIPILHIPGLIATPNPLAASIESGGAAYLERPEDVDDLVKVVESLIDRTAADSRCRTMMACTTAEIHQWRVVTGPDGAIETWRLVDANPAALRAWGLTRGQTLNRTVDDIMGPGTFARCLPTIRRVMEERISLTCEEHFPALGRRYRLTTVPLSNGFVTTGEDITEIRRTEDALRETEQRLRLALRNAPISVAAQDRDLRYVWAFNQTMSSINAMLGRTDYDLLPRADADHVVAMKRRVLEEGIELTERLWVNPPTGRKFLDVFWEPLRDDSGDVIGVASTALDLTAMKVAEDALRESEAHYRTLSDTMLQGVVYQDREGRILSMNPAAEAILGRSRESFLGANSEAHQNDTLREDGSPFPGHDHPSMEALRTGREVRGVCMGIHNPRENRRRWINITAVPLFRPGETSPYQVYTVFEDVTERKQAEQALRESRATLETFFAVSPGILIILDSEFRYLNTDPLTPSYFGLDRATIVGKRMSDLAPDFLKEHGDLFRQVIDTGKPVFNVAMSGVAPATGETTYWRATYFPVRIAGGETGLGIVGVEITDIRKAEAALRASEEQFRTLANAIPQLCWMARGDGWIYWYNQRWHDYTGMTPEQMEGWGWRSVHDPEMLPKVIERWNATLETGEPFDMVFPLRGADGSFRPFLTRVAPVRDADGAVTGWFGSNTDISEQLAIEDALRRSNQDLEQFAYAASHDLQEPLRTISIYTEMLARRRVAGDEQERQFIEWILAGTRRMQALLQGLLEYSRISAADLAPAEAIDSEEALAVALRNLKGSIEESGALVTHDALPWVNAQEVHLIQVFQNLISNAIRYRAAAPPRIHVSVTGAGAWRRFSVADNGIGVEAKYSDYIFRVFKRVAPSSDSGAGVGLAICKRIVERWGGRIWVESEPAAGATFYFTATTAPDL